MRKLVHDMGDDIGAEAFVRQQTAIIGRPDSRPTLAWIKCPTLVLTGDEDNTIPNSLSKEMADGIHGAKLVILPNCGHLPQPEQPEATADALVEWLRSLVLSKRSLRRTGLDQNGFRGYDERPDGCERT